MLFTVYGDLRSPSRTFCKRLGDISSRNSHWSESIAFVILTNRNIESLGVVDYRLVADEGMIFFIKNDCFIFKFLICENWNSNKKSSTILRIC